MQRVRLTDEEPPVRGQPDKAAMEVVGTPRLGCPILLRGTNWLVQDASVGSTIAIKLDDGVYQKPGGGDVDDGVVGTMPMGDVEHVLTLPDGSTGPKGSNPAYPAGPHWIRLLTGSTGGDLRRNPTIDIEAQPAGKCDPLPTDPNPDPAVDTTVTADPATQVYGQTTDLTVSVSPDATGSVNITAGAQTLTGTLTHGTASVTIPATTLEPGVHDLAITYPGVEGKFNPSTGTAKVTVTKATPKVKVKAPKKVKRGKTATISATVTATGVQPGRQGHRQDRQHQEEDRQAQRQRQGRHENQGHQEDPARHQEGHRHLHRRHPRGPRQGQDHDHREAVNPMRPHHRPPQPPCRATPICPARHGRG